MKIVFQERGNLSITEIQPPPVKLAVDRYSHAAIGGPERAQINAYGKPMDLLQFLDWLRVKVTIESDGIPRWWGYIHRVEVYYDSVCISADLDRMSNRIATAYTLTSVGSYGIGDRYTTDWTEDRNSIRIFGYKELLLSASDTTATGAETVRDTALSNLAIAQAGFSTAWGKVTEPYAVLYCRGWWETLSWRYTSVPTELALAYETIGDSVQAFGDDTYEEFAQAFDVSSDVNLQEIEVYAAKVGSPADNLKIAIHENPDDTEPGTEIDSATISGASLSTSHAWVRVSLSPALELTAGSSYFLVVSRSGSQDATNHYSLKLDPFEGYGAGPLVVYDGGSWGYYAGSMPFRLYDNVLVETTQQIQRMLVNHGQFLRRVRIEDVSGIDTASYRNGDTNARYEIEALMKIGTTNKRRILATVNPDRTVRVYEQDNASSLPHYITSRGEIYDPHNNPLDKATCPAGVWVSPRDILPAVGLTAIGGLQAFFIERMEYNISADRLSYQPANLPDPWDIGINYG